GFRGEGRFEPATFPLKTAGREFEVEISSTALSWRSEDGVWAAFDVAPFRMDMLEDAARHPIRVEDVNGQVRSKNGWSLAGDISGVSAMFGDIQMDQGVAGYRLAGGGGASLSGGLSDVSAQFRDGADTQRFAPMAFSGGGDLAGGVAAFTGRFFDDESGVSIAAGAGRHELETGSGLFSLTPTPLVFRRGGLQPADLVPRLRGVAANVEGRVDVSGVVSWTRENVESTALVLVSDLGFATAGAGVFEGVNARVGLDDVLNVRSPPGQVATIARLNPGVPIEDGRLRFQLLGPGQIELESAVWPFAGGSLAILPTIWDTDAEENLVTAEARDLDLSDIVERFNIPDAVAIGRVSGRFPMAFGVGGVAVKDAALQADESGGTLQYLGDIGAAASDTDRSVKLFFDAVKNFKYRVLRIGLDGDVAGEMTLSLALEGHNPDVLDGFPFNLNVGLTADLVSLLNSRSPAQAYVDAVVDAVSGGQETQFD
ncbi:MAG: YdbH domain-containing protein, partial [Pseudomonadota bacterium]